MLSGVDSLTALPPPNMSDRRVIGTPFKPIHGSEASTILHLYVRLLVPIVLELSRF